MAYVIRISDCSSDVCSSDLVAGTLADHERRDEAADAAADMHDGAAREIEHAPAEHQAAALPDHMAQRRIDKDRPRADEDQHGAERSEEHTSELQSLMRISYADFCLKKKKQHTNTGTK